MSDIQAQAPIADVATTPAQPAPSGVPASVPDVQAQGQTLVQAVGAVVSASPRVRAALSRLSRSRTLYGLLGLLGVNLYAGQPIDIRLWINGEIYNLGNIAPLLSIILAGLAAWGRWVAQGPIVPPRRDRG